MKTLNVSMENNVREKIASQVSNGHASGALFGIYRENEVFQVYGTKDNVEKDGFRRLGQNDSIIVNIKTGETLYCIGAWVSEKHMKGVDFDKNGGLILIMRQNGDLLAFFNKKPVHVETWSMKDLEKRNVGILNPMVLRQKTVLIIGQGTLGSNITAQLSLYGLRIIVCDPQRIGIENIIRWRGTSHKPWKLVGRYKVSLAEEMANIVNPTTRIHGFPIDITTDEEQFIALFDEYNISLVIDTADSEEAKNVSNAIAYKKKIPFISSALSNDGAKSGEIKFVDPAKGTPCYRCLTPKKHFVDKGTNKTYGVDAGNADTVSSGLLINIQFMACMVSSMALEILQGRDIWGTFMEKPILWFSLTDDRSWLFSKPYQKIFCGIKPEVRFGCPVCDPENYLKSLEQCCEKEIEECEAEDDELMSALLGG